MITNFNNTQAKPISFCALKKVKYTGMFNPKKNKEDFATINGIALSDTLRYLIENYDVKLEFDKFEYPEEDIIHTVLHFNIEPIPDKEQNFVNRLLTKLKYSVLGNPEIKKGWIEATYDKNSGKRCTMLNRILNYTMDDLNKLLGIN